MTRFLYLVRHGEAVPHDGPLSEAGERQARLTGKRLKDVPFSAIHHGPLPRAAQTAALIAAYLPEAELRRATALRADGKPATVTMSLSSSATNTRSRHLRHIRQSTAQK